MANKQLEAGPTIQRINELYRKLSELPVDAVQQAIESQRFVSKADCLRLCQGSEWSKAFCNSLISQTQNGIDQLLGAHRRSDSGNGNGFEPEQDDGETRLENLKQRLAEQQALKKRADEGEVRMDQVRYEGIVANIKQLNKDIFELDRRVHPPKSGWQERRFSW